jgi:hypothetical protein
MNHTLEYMRVHERKKNLTMKNAVFWDLHSATSQKTVFFIVTAVKTSNLTKILQTSLFSDEPFRTYVDRYQILET